MHCVPSESRRPMLVRALTGLLALSLGACASPSLTLPDGFLRLEAQTFMAVTADDGKLHIREFTPDESASLTFWCEAVREDLVRNRGYELTAEMDVVDGAGRPGRCMEFSVMADGERHGYLLAVWMRSSAVRVVEFTAREEIFRMRVGPVRRALSTLRP